MTTAASSSRPRSCFGGWTTPVDFAFAVHSAVGSHCIGAKVNQRIVPLDTILHSGDMVDVIISKNQHPNKNWMKFVQTQKAKAEIRKWLNKEEEIFVEKGKELWDKKLKKLKLSYSPDETLKFAVDQKFDNSRNLYKAIGQGKVDIEEMIRLSEEKEKIKNTPDAAKNFESFTKFARATGGGLLIDGNQSNMMVSYSKCCNPIPGDPVAGYITTGDGIKIHRKTCKNLLDISKREPEKIVSIQWPDIDSSSFIVALMLKGEDSPGLLNEIAHQIVSFKNTNIKSISIDTQDYSQHTQTQIGRGLAPYRRRWKQFREIQAGGHTQKEKPKKQLYQQENEGESGRRNGRARQTKRGAKISDL